jgi:hypothetical protein
MSAASVLTEGIWAHAVVFDEAATSCLGAIAEGRHAIAARP